MPQDTRTYITVHDGLPEHPKVETLSDKAFRLLVETWCYCSRNNTDGHVRQAVWARRGTPRARQELIDAGLASLTDDGVEMHDYLRHQRSAAERVELREKRANAGKLGGQARSRTQASAKQVPEQNASTVPSKTEAVSVTATKTEQMTTSSVVAPAPPAPPDALTRAPRGTRLPDPYPLTEDMQAWGREHAPHAGPRDHEDFCDYWHAKAGRDAIKANWRLTWQRWMRKASDERPATRPPGGRPAGPMPMDRAADVADIGRRLQAQHDAQTAMEA